MTFAAFSIHMLKLVLLGQGGGDFSGYVGLFLYHRICFVRLFPELAGSCSLNKWPAFAVYQSSHPVLAEFLRFLVRNQGLTSYFRI
jgi:hypothetical protein